VKPKAYGAGALSIVILVTALAVASGSVKSTKYKASSAFCAFLLLYER
jgi:hypothetical protein